MNVSENQRPHMRRKRVIQVFVVQFLTCAMHVNLVSDTCVARRFCVCRHVRHIAHVFGSDGQGERLARQAAIDESLFSALSKFIVEYSPNHVAGDILRCAHVWQHTVA